MGDCICSNCSNLKKIMENENEEARFECEYGFPSEDCIECETDDCDMACEHYEGYNGEEEPIIVHCSRCGKELEKVIQDDEDGEIMCVDCFLKG